MAEGEDVVVSPLVQSLLDKLASDGLCYFGSEWNIQNELEELSNVLENIQAMLGCLEIMQTRDLFLKCHLQKLRDVAYDTNVVLDEFIYEFHRGRLQHEKDQHTRKIQVCKYFSFSLNVNQVLYQHEIAPLINDLKEKLVQIQNNLKPHYSLGSSLEMEGRLRTIQLEGTRKKSGSFIRKSHVVNREKDVNVIKQILLLPEVQNNSQGEVPVIAIIGMGGIGKTTLAQLVYNDSDVEKHFDLKAWVCVSNDFNVERVTEAILESTTTEPCNLKNLEPIQGKLRAELSGKKFLLVLDDVWNENQTCWDDIIDPVGFAEMGSRIIITTCNRTVLSIMNTVYCHDLQCLSNEDCWSVIKRRAFLGQNSVSFPNLEAIGRKIAEKCKGLPLAANTLGGLLRSRLDEDAWQDILQRNQWTNILPSLSVSYHYLPPHLKQCFTYCSLFPKGHEFDKKKLIRLWMAQGFIPSKRVELMEDIGSQYFDDLLARSFFQKRSMTKETIYVVHDVLHDLAESVSGKQCVRIDKSFQKCSTALSKEGSSAPTVIDEIDSADDVLLTCKSFYTCLSSYVFVNEWLLPDLIQRLRWLCVLDLSDNGIKIIPDSIGELKHLRYLDLSSNYVQVLPESMCKLYNLQTLNLERCMSFHSLPLGMRNLVNLQYLMTDLLIGDTPPDIGRLTCLKTLSIFHVGQTDGCTIRELKELRHLQGKITITGLENVVNAEDASEAKLKNKPKLRRLELKWRGMRSENLGRDITTLEGLKPHADLKDLSIESYGGSRFPNWMMIDLLEYTKLVSVTLDDCARCEFLPPLGQLPVLQILCLSYFENVEQLGDEFYGGSEKRFQSLQFLTLRGMGSLRKWIGAKEGEFPCLKKLYIFYCEKLMELPPFLPTVKKLSINSCNELSALPSLPSISKLHLSSCNDKIFDQLHHCTSLSSLLISEFPNSRTLPPNIPLQNLARLKNLTIEYCPNLISLPRGLCYLSSLEKLRIWMCPSLQSLPEDGFPTSLHLLGMFGIDVLLKSRCEEGKEDWPKIAHIPHREICANFE